MSHILEIDPDTELKFTLSHKEATPRCVLTLKHPGTTGEHLAFKVKTTQPRRYLVRPNQGLIAPKGSETISILLVEKDKQILLQSFDRLGQSGLDHSKDKFLVQSCAVNSAFSAKLKGDSNELYEALTSMWNSVTAGGSTTPLFNKKLHVRHTVQEAGGAANTARSVGTAASSFKPEGASTASVENMTQDQMASELSNLRRKYDELVSFSVNLTAERDILSNTLEQTKRDYNREMAARSALVNKQGGGSAAGGKSTGSLKSFLIQLMIIGLAGFLYGIRLGTLGKLSFMRHAPLIGFIFQPEPVAVVEAVAETMKALPLTDMVSDEM